MTAEHVQTLRRQFGEQRGAIEQEKYEPIKAVRIFNRHYIADGKYRAATCALLNVPVKCVDASDLIHDSFFWWVQRRMLRVLNIGANAGFYTFTLAKEGSRVTAFESHPRYAAIGRFLTREKGLPVDWHGGAFDFSLIRDRRFDLGPRGCGTQGAGIW